MLEMSLNAVSVAVYQIDGFVTMRMIVVMVLTSGTVVSSVCLS